MDYHEFITLPMKVTFCSERRSSMMSEPSLAKKRLSSVKTINRGNQTISDDTVWRSTIPDRSHDSFGGSLENALRTVPIDAALLNAIVKEFPPSDLGENATGC
jgi:hypothetical protein